MKKKLLRRSVAYIKVALSNVNPSDLCTKRDGGEGKIGCANDTVSGVISEYDEWGGE